MFSLNNRALGKKKIALNYVFVLKFNPVTLYDNE
jgi:hypothetical protein